MSVMFTVAMLSAAATYAVDSEAATKTYSDCLTKLTIEHLDLKTSTSMFRKEVAKACVAEREAMITGIVKDELGYGSTKAEAESYANEEATSISSSVIDYYGDYLRSGTQPVLD